MIIKDTNFNWLGKYEVIVTKKDGTVEKEEIFNTITNEGLKFLSEVIAGEEPSGKFLYLGIGTDDTPPDVTDTQLGNELERVLFRDYTFPENGTARQRALILDNEAIFDIKELGVFAGSSATGAVNTGKLISRVLYSRNKTNLESIQVIRVDSFSRGA